MANKELTQIYIFSLCCPKNKKKKLGDDPCINQTNDMLLLSFPGENPRTHVPYLYPKEAAATHGALENQPKCRVVWGTVNRMRPSLFLGQATQSGGWRGPISQ